MREIEVNVPPRHVKWFVMNRTFPVMVAVQPDGEEASFGAHAFRLYPGPAGALHVQRKGGTVLGTISKEKIVGAITEDAARDLKALRAALYEVDFEFVIAYMFRDPTSKRRKFTHAQCRSMYETKRPGIESTPQFFIKGTPDCVACGGAIE